MKVRIYNAPKSLKLDVLKRAVEFFGTTLMSKRMCAGLTIFIRFSETHKQENLEDGNCTWEDDNHRPKEFSINLHSYKSMSKVLTTLAHEMVHVKQFATGEMRDLMRDAHLVSWQGKRFDIRDVDYWDYPWEIDAHGRELGLYVRFKDLLEKEKRDAKKVTKTKKPSGRKLKAATVPQEGCQV